MENLPVTAIAKVLIIIIKEVTILKPVVVVRAIGLRCIATAGYLQTDTTMQVRSILKPDSGPLF
jgi:hypothetical protein